MTLINYWLILFTGQSLWKLKQPCELLRKASKRRISANCRLKATFPQYNISGLSSKSRNPASFIENMMPKQSCSAANQLLLSASWQLLGCILWFAIPTCTSGCSESYICRPGRYCCNDNTCETSCNVTTDHEDNAAAIIGIVAAVVVGNVLFWVSFCCVCWCRSAGKKHNFRYRPFADKQPEEDENDDERTQMTCDGDAETRAEEIGLTVLVIQNPKISPNPNPYSNSDRHTNSQRESAASTAFWYLKREG